MGRCTDLATLCGDWSTGFGYVQGVLEPTPRSAQGQLKFLGSQVICGCSTAQGWVSQTPRCSRVSAPKCYQLQHHTFHFPASIQDTFQFTPTDQVFENEYGKAAKTNIYFPHQKSGFLVLTKTQDVRPSIPIFGSCPGGPGTSGCMEPDLWPGSSDHSWAGSTGTNAGKGTMPFAL